MQDQSKAKGHIKWIHIFALSFGAGLIYFLPYLRGAYYQPLMEALGVTHTQLGIIQSSYGIFTIIGYFPGGWLADRFSPRKLLTISYVATGIGGIYYAQFPSFNHVILLHIFFGITTSVTFWAAMIKAARLCADANGQGRVFGILEGGRGIIAVLASMVAVALFAKFGSGPAGLRAIIYMYSALLLVIGAVIWFVFRDEKEMLTEDTVAKITMDQIKRVFNMPIIWIITGIIFCAYTSYRCTDFLTPYMTKVCGVSATMGALLGTIRMYGVRPFGAIAAGFMADRISSSRSLRILFLAVVITNIIYVIFPGSPKLLYLVIVNMIVLMASQYAIRGIYWALLEEGKVPIVITGTATGVISTLAYTPDIFNPILGGWALDRFPGDTGYRIIFAVAGVSMAGAILLIGVFRRYIVGQKQIKTDMAMKEAFPAKAV